MFRNMFASVVVLVTVLCVHMEAATRYTVTELKGYDDIIGEYQAQEINNRGQVVIQGNLGSDRYQTYVYGEGKLRTVGPKDNNAVRVTGINDQGHVVGYARKYLLSPTMGFIDRNGEIYDLYPLELFPENSLNGINNTDQSVGTMSFFPNSHYEVMVLDGNSVSFLGTLGGNSSVGRSINDIGQIAGDIWGNEYEREAFIYQAGNVTRLGTLGGNASNAEFINNKGQVAGLSRLKDDNLAHVFLYSDGVMKDLVSYPGSYLSLGDLNIHGQIVGSVEYSTNDPNPPIHRAYLFSEKENVDLNTLIDPASGWVLESATGNNDWGQIVGNGTLNGKKRSFLLTLLGGTPIQAIQKQPERPVYGDCPVKEEGKDSLVVVTHGWNNRFLSPFTPSDPKWVDTMSEKIKVYLTNHNKNNWQVYGYKWEKNAWTFQAPVALYNARGEGMNLGSAISVQGWRHVHLIGHSAGAALIQEASEWIKARGITVHCTFLDPYVGIDNSGVNTYGYKTDWSDCYFSHDVTMSKTEQPLNYARNVDVTQLGPKTGIRTFRSQASGQMEVCTHTIKYHEWPIDFYMNTIVSSNVDSEYAGFGFPLSKEGGGWNSGIPSYAVGNIPAQLLGKPDPDCMNDVSITPPTWPNLIPDLLKLNTIDSITGSHRKGNGYLELIPGSPSWVSTTISATNPLNSVSFDAYFSSVMGSENILSVLWDTNIVGILDERIVQPGRHHYSLKFPVAGANSSHVLSFRLDPFASTMSSITLTNIVLTQIGASQPCYLSITSNLLQGLPVYQLEGEAGFIYDIQVSTNLSSNIWNEVAELINVSGTVQFYDPDSRNDQIRFYRAITSQ